MLMILSQKQTSVNRLINKQSLARALEPVTSKLDDIIGSSRMPPQGKQPPRKKGPVPDYGISIDDEIEDEILGDIFGENVPPQKEKQLVPKLPTYEEALKDLEKGKKKIYVSPEYLPELPPVYDYDEGIDYTVKDEDEDEDEEIEEIEEDQILDDSNLQNYESVEKVLKQPEMTPKKTEKYLAKIVKDAKKEKKTIGGKRTAITKEFNKGLISKDEKEIRNLRLDAKRDVLNDYIKFHEKKLNLMDSKKTGKGRKKKGGNIMFFNDANQLLKKLELIIGEILAGNNSIKMRNTGVAILDMLLKMATINRPQYNKLYNQYFKVKI